MGNPEMTRKETTHRPGTTAPLAWDHAVHDIPDRGLSTVRQATPDELAAIARALDLVACTSLRADVHHCAYPGRALPSHRAGCAPRCTQACVVTLEPVASTIEEAFEAAFWPAEDMPVARQRRTRPRRRAGTRADRRGTDRGRPRRLREPGGGDRSVPAQARRRARLAAPGVRRCRRRQAREPVCRARRISRQKLDGAAAIFRSAHGCDSASAGGPRNLFVSRPQKAMVGRFWGSCGHGRRKRDTTGLGRPTTVSRGVMATPRTISLDAMGGDQGPGGGRARRRHRARAPSGRELPAVRRPGAHCAPSAAHPRAGRAIARRAHRHGRRDAGQAEPGGAPRRAAPACGWRSRRCRRARPTSRSRPATPAP